MRRATAVHPIAAVQSEYAFWSRDPEREILNVCAELGTIFVAYSPLGRAFLTGSLSTAALAENNFRKHNPRFQGEAALANRVLVDGLHQFAEARNLTNTQVALGWLLAKNPHVIPIPGARRIAHLEQNVAATSVQLTLADVGELDALFALERVAGARYPEAGMVGIE